MQEWSPFLFSVTLKTHFEKYKRKYNPVNFENYNPVTPIKTLAVYAVLSNCPNYDDHCSIGNIEKGSSDELG